MKIIYYRNLRFINFEGLFRFMVRNNMQKVKYSIENNGIKSKQQVSTYEEIENILIQEKYNVKEIIEHELKNMV